LREDGTGLAVLAVQHIQRMRGGAQGQLMLGADGHIYVVKFQNNPQHIRVLANEFLASRLAGGGRADGPEVELVDVSNWLMRTRRSWRLTWDGRECVACRACTSDRDLWAD